MADLNLNRAMKLMTAAERETFQRLTPETRNQFLLQVAARSKRKNPKKIRKSKDKSELSDRQQAVYEEIYINPIFTTAFLQYLQKAYCEATFHCIMAIKEYKKLWHNMSVKERIE